MLVLIFGGATLVLRDPRFHQVEADVFLWLVALAFLGSSGSASAPLAQRLLGAALGEPAAIVPRRAVAPLNCCWVAFYALLGALNLVVADTPASAPGSISRCSASALRSLVFAVAQALWLATRAPSPRVAAVSAMRTPHRAATGRAASAALLQRALASAQLRDRR